MHIRTLPYVLYICFPAFTTGTVLYSIRIMYLYCTVPVLLYFRVQKFDPLEKTTSITVQYIITLRNLDNTG